MKNNYASRWLIQRITALLLVPLSFWFIFHCISFKNFSFLELTFFFKSYLNSILFLILMSAMLTHAKLGCDTIIQDYISRPYLKKILKRSINFITFLSLFFVFLAIFRLNIY